MTHFLVEANPATLIDVLAETPNATIETIPLRALYDHDKDYFRPIEIELLNWQTRSQINRNTLGRFGTLWVRNLGRNLPLLAEAAGIHALTGRFDAMPALVLGAGPVWTTFSLLWPKSPSAV